MICKFSIKVNTYGSKSYITKFKHIIDKTPLYVVWINYIEVLIRESLPVRASLKDFMMEDFGISCSLEARWLATTTWSFPQGFRVDDGVCTIRGWDS